MYKRRDATLSGHRVVHTSVSVADRGYTETGHRSGWPVSALAYV